MDSFNKVLLFLFIVLLPTQLGKHFFFPFSYISGVRVDYLAPTLYLTDIVVFLLALVNWRIFLDMLKNRFVLSSILILLLHSLIVAVVPSLAYYRLLKFIEIVFVFFLVKKMRPSQGLVLWGFLTGAVLEVVLSVFQFATKHAQQGLFYFFGERAITLSMPDVAKGALQGVEFLRPYGTFSHPNSMAGFYLLLYTYVLTLKKNDYPWLTRTILLGSSILIFLSFSKVAIGLFLLVNFSYLVIKGDFSCKLCMISRGLVLASLALVFMSAQTDPLSVAKRGELFQSAFEIVKTNPWGTGLGNYLIVQGKMSSRFILLAFQPVHNIFIYLLSEVGIFLFGILVFVGVKEVTREKRSFAFFLCLGIVAMSGVADHYWVTLQQNLLLMPVIFALLAMETGLARR